MSRNGSGTFLLVAGNPVVTGTPISSAWANATLNDIAAALTQSFSVDGQAPATGNWNLATYKLTNLGNGSTATDSVTYGQVFNGPAFTSPTAVASPNSGDNSLLLATTNWANSLAFSSALPAVSTATTKMSVRNNGTVSSWQIPLQYYENEHTLRTARRNLAGLG
jgi:hypothetical protein